MNEYQSEIDALKSKLESLKLTLTPMFDGRLRIDHTSGAYIEIPTDIGIFEFRGIFYSFVAKFEKRSKCLEYVGLTDADIEKAISLENEIDKLQKSIDDILEGPLRKIISTMPSYEMEAYLDILPHGKQLTKLREYLKRYKEQRE